MADYEELVARLREADEKSMCGECGLNLHSGATKKGILFADAADAIEDLIAALTASNEVIAKSRDKWISVEERLPKNELETYWVYTSVGSQHSCRWTNNRFGLGVSDKWGWSVFDIPQYTNVTHWMPLPQAPKEET